MTLSSSPYSLGIKPCAMKVDRLQCAWMNHYLQHHTLFASWDSFFEQEAKQNLGVWNSSHRIQSLILQTWSFIIVTILKSPIATSMKEVCASHILRLNIRRTLFFCEERYFWSKFRVGFISWMFIAISLWSSLVFMTCSETT